jgi:hypothetical protein
MRIKGLDLTGEIDINFVDMGWSTLQPTGGSRITRIVFKFDVINDLPDEMFNYFAIFSPEGIMFNDPKGVTQGTHKLPIVESRPFTVAGNQLLVQLLKGNVVSANTYEIFFSITNPTNVPFDHTWKFVGYKGEVEKYVEIIPGYSMCRQNILFYVLKRDNPK